MPGWIQPRGGGHDLDIPAEGDGDLPGQLQGADEPPPEEDLVRHLRPVQLLVLVHVSPPQLPVQHPTMSHLQVTIFT